MTSELDPFSVRTLGSCGDEAGSVWPWAFLSKVTGPPGDLWAYLFFLCSQGSRRLG